MESRSRPINLYKPNQQKHNKNINKPSISPRFGYRPTTAQVSLPYLEETQEFHASSLKQSFDKFHNSIATFIFHSNESLGFRDDLATAIGDFEHFFSVFYIHVAKLCGPTFGQGRRPNLVSGTSALRSAAEPFFHTWELVTDILSQISELGSSCYKESIELKFAEISNSIELVKNHPNRNSTIHDPLIISANKLLQLHSSTKEQLFQLLNNYSQEGSKASVSIIKHFSRQLNSCFNNEFQQCTIGQTELEKIRSQSFINCNELIQATRAAILYESDMNHIESNGKSFQTILESFAQHLNLDISSFIIKREKKEDNPTDLLFPSNASIHEILNLGYEKFRAENISPTLLQSFFETIRLKVFDLLKISDHAHELENQILKMKQNEETRTKINNVIYGSSESNSDKIKSSEESISSSNFEKLKEIEKKLRLYMKEFSNDSKVNIDINDTSNNESNIDTILFLCNSIISSRKISDFKIQNENSQIKEILNSVIQKDEQESALDLAKEATKLISSLETEIKNSRKTINDLKESIQNSNNGTSEIQETNKQEIISEIDKQRKDEIVQKIKEVLGEQFLNSISSDNYIDEILKINKTNTSLLIRYQEFMELTISNLIKILSLMNQSKFNTTQKNDSVFETIPILINKLQEEIEKMKNKILELSSKSEKEYKTELQELEEKMRKYCNFEKKPQSGNNANLLQLISFLNEMMNFILKENQDIHQHLLAINDRLRILNSTNGVTNNSLIQISSTTNNIPENMRLLKKISENLDIIQCNSKSLNTQITPLSNQELNQMFSGVIPLIPVSSTDNPRLYLPEICFNFLTFHSSIFSLKPFSEILNDIFKGFDCKLSSFMPSSSSFSFLRENIAKLEKAVNSLVPSNVHSLLFLVISHLVSLLSSFTAAISSLSFSSQSE